MAEILVTLGISEIDDLTALVHQSVQEFVQVVSSEYIEYSSEKKKEQTAAEAITKWEKSYKHAEIVLSSSENSSDMSTARKLVAEIKEATNADIISYHRGVLRLEQRKIQYFKCSPLTRSFVSPRATRWDPWEDDTASPRSRELGTFYCVFIPFVVFALFATGYILSSLHIGERTDEINQRQNILAGLDITFLSGNGTLQNFLSSTGLKERLPCSAGVEEQKIEL